jgi:hypothetical protein
MNASTAILSRPAAASAPLRRLGALMQWLATAWPSRASLSTTDIAKREAAREVASVRALADRYQRSDPGFASDLYAAAARYEQAVEASRAP